MNIGFTGTRHGMSSGQRTEVLRLVRALRVHGADDKRYHHGDCIGSDEQFHMLIVEHFHTPSDKIFVHPPISDRLRAFCDGPMTRVLEPKDYLTRDRDIVAASDILIATPGERKMIRRSGTWATIRYSLAAGVPTYIVTPRP